MIIVNSSVKRTFLVIRLLILACLSTGRKTINQISTETKINWRTVELHLNHLVGRRYAREVFSSEFVRIFEITENGIDYVKLESARLNVNFENENGSKTKDVRFNIYQ